MPGITHQGSKMYLQWDQKNATYSIALKHKRIGSTVKLRTSQNNVECHNLLVIICFWISAHLTLA